jgi:hypothetical protein
MPSPTFRRRRPTRSGIQALVGAQDQFLGFGLVEIDRADGGAHVPGDGGHRLRQKRVEAGLEIEEADQFADVAHQRHVVFWKSLISGFSFPAPPSAAGAARLDFSPKKSTFLARFVSSCPMV